MNSVPHAGQRIFTHPPADGKTARVMHTGHGDTRVPSAALRIDDNKCDPSVTISVYREKRNDM